MAFRLVATAMERSLLVISFAVICDCAVKMPGLNKIKRNVIHRDVFKHVPEFGDYRVYEVMPHVNAPLYITFRDKTKTDLILVHMNRNVPKLQVRYYDGFGSTRDPHSDLTMTRYYSKGQQFYLGMRLALADHPVVQFYMDGDLDRSVYLPGDYSAIERIVFFVDRNDTSISTPFEVKYLYGSRYKAEGKVPYGVVPLKLLVGDTFAFETQISTVRSWNLWSYDEYWSMYGTIDFQNKLGNTLLMLRLSYKSYDIEETQVRLEMRVIDSNGKLKWLNEHNLRFHSLYSGNHVFMIKIHITPLRYKIAFYTPAYAKVPAVVLKSTPHYSDPNDIELVEISKALEMLYYEVESNVKENHSYLDHYYLDQDF